LEGEDTIALGLDVCNLLNDWGVLLVDVRESQVGAERFIVGAVCASSISRKADAKVEGLRLGHDILGFNGERREDWEIDSSEVDSVAGARDDKALVQSREGELTGASCQEWKGARDLIEDSTIESVLLALLADN